MPIDSFTHQAPLNDTEEQKTSVDSAPGHFAHRKFEVTQQRDLTPDLTDEDFRRAPMGAEERKRAEEASNLAQEEAFDPTLFDRINSEEHPDDGYHTQQREMIAIARTAEVPVFTLEMAEQSAADGTNIPRLANIGQILQRSRGAILN